MRVQILIIEAGIMADLVQHGFADLLAQLGLCRAYAFMRSLEQGDGVPASRRCSPWFAL